MIMVYITMYWIFFTANVKSFQKKTAFVGENEQIEKFNDTTLKDSPFQTTIIKNRNASNYIK